MGAEMSEQIDQLSKMKAKIEKDKGQIQTEILDIRNATDEMNRSKASAEKSNKNLIAALNEVNRKVEEANLTIGDFENAKRKISAENADLLRQLGELQNHANMLTKGKAQMVSQLDEARKVSDDEARDRLGLLGKYKNLEHELQGMKDQLDEETALKEDILRQLSKALQESDMWRLKYEKEGLAKMEELEMTQMKLQARFSESQGTIEQLNAKLGQIDKAKAK